MGRTVGPKQWTVRGTCPNGEVFLERVTAMDSDEATAVAKERVVERLGPGWDEENDSLDAIHIDSVHRGWLSAKTDITNSSD